LLRGGAAKLRRAELPR